MLDNDGNEVARGQAGEIVDRKKDMIITGGFNVYPNEVEQVLMTHVGKDKAAA